jgi:hypothetical protein
LNSKYSQIEDRGISQEGVLVDKDWKRADEGLTSNVGSNRLACYQLLKRAKLCLDRSTIVVQELSNTCARYLWFITNNEHGIEFVELVKDFRILLSAIADETLHYSVPIGLLSVH